MLLLPMLLRLPQPNLCCEWNMKIYGHARRALSPLRFSFPRGSHSWKIVRQHKMAHNVALPNICRGSEKRRIYDLFANSTPLARRASSEKKGVKQCLKFNFLIDSWKLCLFSKRSLNHSSNCAPRSTRWLNSCFGFPRLQAITLYNPRDTRCCAAKMEVLF